jgi:ribosomal protein S18 acetylase RimI-like enzyme
MTSIIKAKKEHAPLLAEIGKVSFIESHGNSAAPDDINKYVEHKFTDDVFLKEVSDDNNEFHIIYYNNTPAGYSKIIFDSPHRNILHHNVTKLERIYLLKEFYGLKLGQELFEFNRTLSKKNSQNGMWLFVWTENKRAISFYEKTGFKIIGSHNFKISENHSNPNHQMFLAY